MARYEITAPDGSKFEVNAPDTATPEQIQAYAASQFKAQKQTPVPSRPAAPPDPTGSALDNVLAGAGKAYADLGRGAKQLLGVGALKGLEDHPILSKLPRAIGLPTAGEALGLPTSSEVAKNVQRDIDEAKKRDAALMSRGGGITGNIIGNMALAAPAALIPGANAAAGAGILGAIQGLLQPVASGESRAVNTSLGAAGGLAGQGLSKLIGKAVAPVNINVTPERQRLIDAAVKENIPLDLAQVTGSKPLQIANSVLSNLPITAGKEAQKQAAQQAAFNRAVLARAGQEADAATPEVIKAAEQKLGGMIQDATKGQKIGLDEGFQKNIQKTIEQYKDVLDPLQRQELNRVADMFAKGKNVQMHGEAYQTARSMLGRKANSLFKNDPEAARAYQGIQSALDDAAERSLPAEKLAQLSTARSQYGPLMAIEKAMAKVGGSSGDISPAALRTAVALQNPKTYVRGDGQLNDLARIGETFLKNQIPDSGTAQRTAMQNLLTGNMGLAGIGALTGGVSYAGGADPSTAAAMAGLGLLGPRGAQAILNSKALRSYALAGPARQKMATELQQSLAVPAIAGGAGLLGYLGQ